MTAADQARANALQLEIKKDGLAQRQDGRWSLKVIIHPNDMPAALSLAPMGTRYMAALVEVGDDELPVHSDAKEAGTKPREQPTTPTRGADHRSWHELQPSAQATLRCNDPVFWRFLNEDGYGALGDEKDIVTDSAKAATYVRLICGVKSRAQLDNETGPLEHWRALDSQYQAWLRI